MTAGLPDGWTGQDTILFGGSGFLGPYVLERYPDMISVGRRPCPTPNRHVHVDSLEDLSPLDDVAFDRVVYIIGNTDHHDMEKERLTPGAPTAFDYHVIPFLRTMEQLKHRPIQRLIHFSTILIYDDKRLTMPVSEDAPIDPYKNRYVLSKYLSEEACGFYRRWVPITNVRFSNLYGPTPLERYDLIHVLTRTLLRDGKAEIWSRRPRRDFIYVTDAAEAIVRLLFAGHDGTVNLGTGTMTSIGTIVDRLQELSGCPITDRDQPVQGPMEFQCDRTTMRRLIDWEPRVPIEEGVRRCWEFMRDHVAATGGGS